MKCDELEEWYAGQFSPSAKVYGASEVDAAIDELKTEHHKERDEYISMVHSREQTIKELKQKLAEKDKVIALLTDKANYNEYAYKLKYEELSDTCRFYEKELHHHKYKRCLAMARWCHSMWILLRDENETKKSVFYWRWWNLWNELAEKFKEAV